MTYEQFRDEVTDFSELISFCCDYGYEGYTEYIYDEEDYEEYINDEIYNDVSDGNLGWQDLRDWLNDLPELGYPYYIRNDFGEWNVADDDDFDSIMSDLVSELETDDFFESDEEEVEDTTIDFETELEELRESMKPIDDEDFSVDVLFNECSSTLMTVYQAKESGLVAEI